MECPPFDCTLQPHNETTHIFTHWTFNISLVNQLGRYLYELRGRESNLEVNRKITCSQQFRVSASMSMAEYLWQSNAPFDAWANLEVTNVTKLLLKSLR